MMFDIVSYVSDSQADDAVLARLSYTASLRAHELAQRLANKLTVKQVAKIAAAFSGLVCFVEDISHSFCLDTMFS